MKSEVLDVSVTDDLAENLVPGGGMGRPVITAGSASTVIDEDGNAYLDLEAGPGVVSVGHCHPKVVAAIQSPKSHQADARTGPLSQPTYLSARRQDRERDR